MCVTNEEAKEKITFVALQLIQAGDPIRPYVRCRCSQMCSMKTAYKCLYCGEYYCRKCAEDHFGKTVEQYRKENPVPGIESILSEFQQ